MPIFEAEWQGAEGLIDKFRTLAANAKALHQQVPDELVAWQRDDMHRHYPNVETRDTQTEIEASTEIWPRSHTYVHPTKPPGQQGPKQHMPRQHLPAGTSARPRSTRPILRPELITKLDERMVKILHEAWKWPST